MKTKMFQMKCGNCGGDSFEVYGNEDNKDEVHVECKTCQSTTIIRPEAPRLTLDWEKKAKGILCRMD